MKEPNLLLIESSVSKQKTSRHRVRLLKVNRYRGDGFARHQMFASYDDGKTWQLLWEMRSPRPYILGQSCDGTIDDCVYSLFYHFCKAIREDPVVLLNEAYPEEKESFSETYLENAVRVASGEGVIIPEVWSMDDRVGLRKSLEEINLHSLVGLLIDRGLLPDYPNQER